MPAVFNDDEKLNKSEWLNFPQSNQVNETIIEDSSDQIGTVKGQESPKNNDDTMSFKQYSKKLYLKDLDNEAKVSKSILRVSSSNLIKRVKTHCPKEQEVVNLLNLPNKTLFKRNYTKVSKEQGNSLFNLEDERLFDN